MQHPVSIKMALGYALFGTLWLLLGDRFVMLFLQDDAPTGSIQFVNILLFIGITTILLYLRIKRFEASRHQSENCYQQLFESVNDAILILKDNSIVGCNQQARKMFGRSKNELLGHNPWDFSAIAQPDGSDSKQKAMEKYTACIQGSPQHFEWEYLRADDTRFFTAESLNAVELNRQPHVLAIIQDITFNEQEKKELDTYKHIVSASIDSMALVDKDYRYMVVSRSYADSWRKQPEEVVGKKVPDIVGLEAFENDIKPRAERCMAAGEEVRYHIWVPRPDGRRTYNHIVYRPHFVRTKKGAISGYVVSSRDITEMRQMEDKLRQAYKMEAIGTLAGGIAHDFNNILAVILWYAEDSLRQTQEGSYLHTSLKTILETAQRAAELVKQILTFCRQGEQELYPVQIHLLVKEAVKFIRASLPATIEIKTKIESQPLVLADPTQIHQVMMNLCTNAGHAMKDTGGFLTITLTNMDLDENFAKFHPRLKPGPYVKLSISDTGTGIPPEIIDRIFDPFFTTKEEGEGTGMGLSVVHGIVESCGGSVSVYSEPNHGTVFHVYLPVMHAQAEQAVDQPVPVPKGNETILFVDDEVQLVNAGKRILEQLGYKVVISTSGSEAYEKFSKTPDRFDLVITDLTMPYMKGDELARKIRALRPNMPVIMITGLISQFTHEKLDSAPIDKIIMKPLTTRDIATAIRHVLNGTAPET